MTIYSNHEFIVFELLALDRHTDAQIAGLLNAPYREMGGSGTSTLLTCMRQGSSIG